MTATKDMAATIRRAILASGMSGLKLAKLARVPQSTVSLFLTGRRTAITVQTASRLAAALGLELRPAKRQAPRRKGKK